MNVDMLVKIYGKTLLENEKKIKFWESYLKNLKALDLNAYCKKLTVPVLVPVGSRILFRGELKRTNEVTVALGADYFAKCSINQAEILKYHRIKDAKSKLLSLRKERDYIQSQLSFSKRTIYDDTGYDIVEIMTDEEDIKWRKAHRENVRKYKQKRDKDFEDAVADEALWNRLEELEIQEELDNELIDVQREGRRPREPLYAAQANNNRDSDDDDDDADDDVHVENPQNPGNVEENLANEVYMANYGMRKRIFQQPSKLHLFELVVDRHNALKEIVAEMRARQKQSETEEDLVEKIDDMERLEQLEDEIAMLEDMLASDDDDDIEEGEEEDDVDDQQKKSVVFADEDEGETFELTFKHSEVEPSVDPYDPQKGITKPSDIHQAYSSYFNGETTSILKKSKPGESGTSKLKPMKGKREEEQDGVNKDSNLAQAIVVKDVVEKVDRKVKDNTSKKNGKPMSLFKKRRQHSKN